MNEICCKNIQQQARIKMTDLVFDGKLPSAPDGHTAQFIAAAPADYRSSFTGSGLPFANADQAFYGTPNRGKIAIHPDGTFTVRLRMPNSYYVDMGTTLVPPTLHLFCTKDGSKKHAAFRVSHPIPFRTLTYQATRTGPEFYDTDSKFIRSQERILLASGYPECNVSPSDFWGGKPAR